MTKSVLFLLLVFLTGQPVYHAIESPEVGLGLLHEVIRYTWPYVFSIAFLILSLAERPGAGRVLAARVFACLLPVVWIVWIWGKFCCMKFEGPGLAADAMLGLLNLYLLTPAALRVLQRGFAARPVTNGV